MFFGALGEFALGEVTSPVTVELAVTEVKDTVAFTTVAFTGAQLVVTEQKDVAALVASIPVIAELAAVEAKDVLAITAELSIDVQLGATELLDTANFGVASTTFVQLLATEENSDTAQFIIFKADFRSPDGEIVWVPAEIRTLSMPSETRYILVPAKTGTEPVLEEDRTSTAEPRRRRN